MTKGKDRGMPLFDRLVEYEVDEDRFGLAERQSAAHRAPSPPSGSVGPPAASPPGTLDQPLTVSGIVRRAASVLDRSVGTVWLEGEVAECKMVSGHVYFTLKDDSAQIACVMWRSDVKRLRFRLRDGMSILCRGRLGIYDVRGSFQFYAASAEPTGAGADALALEQLKRALQVEGLFDLKRKRALPVIPRRIGIVTSRSGAALRDIVRVVNRRFPVPMLVVDTQVQGPEAPRHIAQALRVMASQRVDVVIVGRGGGAAGDLAAFNDEGVVRAVVASPVPIISAVGHEVDVSLTDLAADVRAATPSQAGELAVPVLADCAAALEKEQRRLRRELDVCLRSARQNLDQHVDGAQARIRIALARSREALAGAERGLAQWHPQARLADDRAALQSLCGRADAAMRRRSENAVRCLAELTSSINAMSPLRVLERGYAIATATGGVLSSTEGVAVGDAVAVRLARGSLVCRVDSIQDEPRGQDPDAVRAKPGQRSG